MKEKQLKYILFPLVALVWGYAIYKYFIYEPEEEAAVAEAVQLGEDAGPPVKAVASQVDTFRISEDYRDPFLGRVQGQRRPLGNDGGGEGAPQVPRVNTPRAGQPAAKAPGINWGRFGYYGTIKPTGADQFYGILTIDGLSYTVSEGQYIRGVQVGAIFEDSLQITYEKEAKTIIK